MSVDSTTLLQLKRQEVEAAKEISMDADVAAVSPELDGVCLPFPNGLFQRIFPKFKGFRKCLACHCRKISQFCLGAVSNDYH